ncbi:hypothetical protein AVEN_157892-1, partial [Araneus ventricosus]
MAEPRAILSVDIAYNEYRGEMKPVEVGITEVYSGFSEVYYVNPEEWLSVPNHSGPRIRSCNMFDVPKPVLLVRMHDNQFRYRMYPIECALENLLSGEDLIFYANTEYLTETPEDAEINYNRIKEVHGIPRNVDEGRGFLP